jgi:hypothetical protein
VTKINYQEIKKANIILSFKWQHHKY